ncbi:MAG: threonine synthase [Acidaminococcus sp.]|nr:threonine synthase [Acidaminococcus sp.]MCI2115309.1 threonine synthase [Acidaminococcus sp.]MCI2117366.1 threonine synthase [Acidaminococcus sp.]
MLYVSTRGKTEMVSSAHAISSGLASDGGLFVPRDFPPVTRAEIDAMCDVSYEDRAVSVLSRFLTDYSEDELRECVGAAYSKEKFGSFPAPLHLLKKDVDVLELWHGPTCAFKDMALQILPHFLTKAIVKTGEQKKVVILVATSGDTGKAAMAGFADVPDTEVIVFYPHGGVSAVQELQMTTQRGANVHAVAVEGNFDDAQTGVKMLFGKEDLNNLLSENGCAFSSANSINWGRLVPQIVYYFSSYADAVKAGRIKNGTKINFSVPTGNFGDILAGYYAKLMGLPVNKFICASNTNNVLTDFINTGTYNRNRPFYKTISPSMDILVSSNLERLLYEKSDHNAAKVTEWMNSLKEKGTYSVGNEMQSAILNDFFGTWVDEIETKETISDVFANYGYTMDPHTAVAYKALEKYRLMTSDTTYTIVLSTASPFKFNDVVLSAINPDKYEGAKLEPFEAMKRLAEVTGLEIPKSMEELPELEVHKSDIVEPASMEAEVKKLLGI